ncbi:MAG: sel1 repeat family protein [Magnetococcales bacterium]|nr:sel1 repeat family protein [Magnetococcales bacterium]
MMLTRKAMAGLAICLGLWGGAAWAAPEDDYKEGLLAQSKDDLQTAMTRFKRAAEAGHLLGMVALGTILDLAEENDAAIVWLLKAAEAGEPSGMERLGEMLIQGEGGKNREKEGLAWIEKGAGLKYPPAMVVLAKILLSGKSYAPVDTDRAMQLLQGAAEIGHVPAIKELVRIYRNGEAGVKADPAQAQAWEAKLPSAAETKTKAGTRKKGDKP